MDIQTTIQVRVEEKIKSKAADILNDIGLDLSSGIKLFLNEVIASESIPFIPSTKKAKELRYFEQYKKEMESAMKEGKRFTSGKELIDDVLKD
jgi:DNA-damage-inducible protein J